ncbi:antA/AntB antirepressor family protein [Brevibacillus formosus]|uniref:antA/AntB antirepressor family protein n=1 Tax=Brevibacillus formosus TaxID=54913 RepID=UPI003F1E3C23
MYLIKINQTERGMTVDARELYMFVNVATPFHKWIERRIETYGFQQGKDFWTFLSESTGGRPSTEYELSIGMAKEICMVENNEKGSQARKYFIEVEDRYKQQIIDTTLLTPELQMFKQLWDGLARTQIENAKMSQQLIETSKKVEVVENVVTVIQETMIRRDDDWRKSVNSMLNAAAYRMGGNYQDLRRESYRILEERARCRLGTRLNNLKERLVDSGATKTKINGLTNMDVIESDSKLKEIYTTVVKELSIGSLRVMGS